MRPHYSELKTQNSTLLAWLQLVRLPNLLTVPGDPLAGYFLALTGTVSCRSILVAVSASLLLYAFGLITNDLFDLKTDLCERPERPLPSGRIKVREAVMVSVLLACVATGCASMNGVLSLAAAVVLAATIVLYNAIGKKVPFVGPVNMGLCRGLSLVLGASAGGMSGILARPVLVAAVWLTAYIAVVSVIASRETDQVDIGFKRWWPALVCAHFLVPLALSGSPIPVLSAARILSACLAGALLFWCWSAGRRLAGTPAPGTVPAVIGKFIQGLLIIQALLLSLCVWPAQAVAAGIILVLPLFSILARRFYSS